MVYTTLIRVLSVFIAVLLVATLFLSILNIANWSTFWAVLVASAIFAFFLPRLRR